MESTQPGHREGTPVVTLIVATWNEAAHIAATLSSIRAQDYPADALEVLVVDGGSRDDTCRIARESMADHPRFELLDNPHRSQVFAWNLGIDRAAGEIIGIVSGHCELDPDYVREAVATLDRTSADLVGGPMRAHSQGRVGHAIALATSSPFGVGGARFHYTEREEEVDTVYMGLCHRQLYERIGAFDTDMICNEDDELSFRIHRNGGRIVCNPAIRSSYQNRATLRSLARQYYRYGFWKVRLMQKHPQQMRLRHFVPGAFVAGLVALAVAAAFWSPALWLLLGVVATYVSGDLVATGALIRRHGWYTAALLPLVFPVLHFCYGVGFVAGLFAWPARLFPGNNRIVR